jgi:hypothetical protein
MGSGLQEERMIAGKHTEWRPHHVQLDAFSLSTLLRPRTAALHRYE